MSLSKKSPFISETVQGEIDRWLKKYPADRKQSAVLTALRLVQEQNGGWLNNELIEAVADYLDMPKITVYEVATFYTMFTLTPCGQHKIDVCTNISCMLSGSSQMIKHLKDRLQINVSETTADGKYTLREVECLGACVGAPVMQIGKEYYENLTAEKIDRILKDLEK